MRLQVEPPEQFEAVVTQLNAVEDAALRLADAMPDFRIQDDAEQAVRRLEKAVEGWLEVSEGTAREWAPDEPTEEGRSPRVAVIGGLAMLNLAVAADVARLSSADELPEERSDDDQWAAPIAAPEPLEEGLTAIQLVAGDTSDGQAAIIAAMASARPRSCWLHSTA